MCSKSGSFSFHEVLGAITVGLVSVSMGLVSGFGTISLADLPLDADQGSWFVSIDLMIAIPFAPLGGKLTQHFGIKNTFLSCAPPTILGWILVGFYPSTFLLFLGRILMAVGVTVMMVSPNVYIAETVHPDIRATLASVTGFAYSLGICILWFFGYFFSWQTVAFLSTIPTILVFLGFLYLPDSPYWLIQNHEPEKALASLAFFRGHSEDISEEFKEMLEHHQAKNEESRGIPILGSPAFWKPFLSIGILHPLYQFSGTLAITNYLQSIMLASGIRLETSTCTMILGIVRLLASVMTLATIQRIPPKITFTIALLIKVVILSILASFFYFDQLNFLSWIPLAMCIILYIIQPFAFSINWILIGESFPTEIRNFAAGFLECIGYASSSIALKCFVDMKKMMGFHGVFFFYTLVAALTAIWGFLTIQDNRSKTLVEIEKNYNSKTPLITKK